MTKLTQILEGTWEGISIQGKFKFHHQIQVGSFGAINDHLLTVETSCLENETMPDKKCLTSANRSTNLSVITFDGNDSVFQVFSPSLFSAERKAQSKLGIKALSVKFLAKNHVVLEQSLGNGFVITKEIRGDSWTTKLEKIDGEPKSVNILAEYKRSTDSRPWE